MPSFPVNHANLLDELEATRTKRIDIMFEYLLSVEESMKSRARILLALGRLSHDTIYASKFRLSVDNTTTMEDRSSSVTPSPTGMEADARRNRLGGVDLAALPAGFGKRRGSGAGGLNIKKSRTPPDAAPEVEPGTNTLSP